MHTDSIRPFSSQQLPNDHTISSSFQVPQWYTLSCLSYCHIIPSLVSATANTTWYPLPCLSYCHMIPSPLSQSLPHHTVSLVSAAANTTSYPLHCLNCHHIRFAMQELTHTYNHPWYSFQLLLVTSEVSSPDRFCSVHGNIYCLYSVCKTRFTQAHNNTNICWHCSLNSIYSSTHSPLLILFSPIFSGSIYIDYNPNFTSIPYYNALYVWVLIFLLHLLISNLQFMMKWTYKM